MGWGTAIGAIASLVGSGIQSNASKNASDSQNRNSQAAMDWIKQVYGDAQGNFSGYLGAGQTGLAGLNRWASGDTSGLFNSPEFKARVKLSNDQFNDGAAANFRLFSGGTQSDRDALNQGLATQGADNYLSRLFNMSQMGQNAAGTLGGIGSQTSQQVSQNYQQMGQNAANAAYNQGNIWGNAANQLGQAASSYYGNQNASGGSNYGVPAQSSGTLAGYGGQPNYQSGGNGTFWGYG